MKIFDLHYVHKNENINKCEIRLLSLKDGHFQLDKAVFDECDKNTLEKETKKRESKERNIEYFSYLYSSMTAFSFNWPFVAFSGLGNTLVVLNAFNRRMIHRIDLVDKDAFSNIGRYERTLIEKTFISDTNDLFALVHREHHYLLYMIDLD